MTEKSFNKANIRHILHARYPRAFVRAGCSDPQLLLEDTIQVLKSVNESNGMCSNVDDLLRALRGNVNDALNYKSSLRVAVLIFDKYLFVPIAKGVEQDKRNARSKSINETALAVPPALSYKQARPYLLPHAPLPADWPLALSDRDQGISTIISDLVAILAVSARDHENEYNFELSHGRRVCIDGHCLTFEKVLALGAIYPSRRLALAACNEIGDARAYLSDRQLWRTHQLDSDAAMYQTPIVFESVFNEQYGESHYVVYFESRARNCIGETDSAIFTLHRLWSRILYDEEFLQESAGAAVASSLSAQASAFPMLNADILSIDTDIGYQALLYLSRIDKRMQAPMPQLCVRYAPALCWAFSKFTTHLSATRERWIDARILYQSIKSGVISTPIHSADESDPASASLQGDSEYTRNTIAKLGEMMMKHVPEASQASVSEKFAKAIIDPVWSTIVALLVGGCDYVPSYYGITHETSYSALVKHASFIGDVAWHVSPVEGTAETWSDVLKPEQKPAGVGLYYVNGAAYVRLVQCAYMFEHGGLVDMDPARVTWKLIRDKTSHLVARNRPPAPQDIERNLLYMIYYVTILCQIGDCCIVEPPNLADYGFRKLDAAKPWSRSNVAYVPSAMSLEAANNAAAAAAATAAASTTATPAVPPAPVAKKQTKSTASVVTPTGSGATSPRTPSIQSVKTVKSPAPDKTATVPATPPAKTPQSAKDLLWD
jgi:hypothetical protein